MRSSNSPQTEPRIDTATLRVDTRARGIRTSPQLYGLFCEDINHAGDSGLYAEMVRNRGFEAGRTPEGCRMEGSEVVNPKGWRQAYMPDSLEGWSLLCRGDASGEAKVVADTPLNAENPMSLRVTVHAARGGEFGVVNSGWWGMSVKKDAGYRLSLYARSADYRGRLRVALVAPSGDVLAETFFEGLSGAWQRFETRLVARATEPSARLVIAASQPGTFHLDMVSLFPEDTFKGRPNGCRKDIAEMLAALKPAFLRFPGGCIVEGITLENRIQWKKTIGDLARRPGHWNLWNYHTSDGLGFHDYLQLCEDLNAAPMYICNAGMSCQGRQGAVVEDSQTLQAYVQDTLDALEYANGPADSTWGAVRAANGHPEPFGIRYLGIGNENGGPVYCAHYKTFVEAVKARYPDLLIVACQNDPAMGTLEIVDEHFYDAPGFFTANMGRYDTYDRNGPRIFVGEYACMHNAGKGNLRAAVAEAAFMIGIEKNSDVVTMASYAPLLTHVNDRRWNPDLIGFDCSRVYGTPSYYVQKLFAQNRPDVLHPTEVKVSWPAQDPIWPGRISLSTWDADVEFRRVRVTRGDEVLFDDDFSAGMSKWQVYSGTWAVENGMLRQKSPDWDTNAFAGDLSWDDYTVRVEARKRGGMEGFMVGVRGRDPQTLVRWNLGGWGNNQHAVVQLYRGTLSSIGPGVRGRIETDRWYTAEIEVKGTHVRCFLDGALIHEGDINPPVPPSIYALAGRDEASGEVVVKVVNARETPVQADIALTGLPSAETVAGWVLTSAAPEDENSIDNPLAVSPKPVTLTSKGGKMNYILPPLSVTVLRVMPEQ
jgi:alpha-L-arabinofuranosidase